MAKVFGATAFLLLDTKWDGDVALGWSGDRAEGNGKRSY